MPRISIPQCCIADVIEDTNPNEKIDGNGNNMNKRVVIHCDEEGFFNMLDTINPNTLIKYLDSRMIPHRDAIRIVIKHIQFVTKPNNGTIRMYLEENEKKLKRASQLMEKYYGH